ncbi:NAD(P)-dependent alcohol dehydrogenase [Deinococcus planocerae]|uniref:NAD(P)-dependent alcohol dehydrogenase n=1 Tax=Deinococcus planocerae TaxID=1737569 RepID=UPI000C7F227F|nr:NAD(P)-dependent alcohol dehydrogenase [Deinococcus planocerae]
MTQRELQVAVVREKGSFQIENARIGAPGPGEVLVRVVAAGLCHTDLIVRDQDLPLPLPMVLGHEGSGVVEEVGEGVQGLAPGDHVVLSFHSCGECATCQAGSPAYCERFMPLNMGGAREDGTHALHSEAGVLHDQFFGQSSFGSYALTHARNTVKVRRDVPLELLGPLGCGIQTGAGAVLRSMKVPAGSSLAAFGAGAVGLSAVMAARVAGAAVIIAVDTKPGRLELARELGATHTVNAAEEDPVAAIRRLTGTGANFTFEATGLTSVMRQAVEALGPRGTCGIVGAPPAGAQASFDVYDLLMLGKHIMGIVEGDSVPREFIPELVDLYAEGRFPFDRLIRYYDLADINQAAADSESGVTLKPVLRMPTPA